MKVLFHFTFYFCIYSIKHILYRLFHFTIFVKRGNYVGFYWVNTLSWCIKDCKRFVQVRSRRESTYLNLKFFLQLNSKFSLYDQASDCVFKSVLIFIFVDGLILSSTKCQNWIVNLELTLDIFPKCFNVTYIRDNNFMFC